MDVKDLTYALGKCIYSIIKVWVWILFIFDRWSIWHTFSVSFSNRLNKHCLIYLSFWFKIHHHWFVIKVTVSIYCNKKRNNYNVQVIIWLMSLQCPHSLVRRFLSVNLHIIRAYIIQINIILLSIECTRRAERASNLTFSKCLHLVDLNIPRILMTHDKMAVIASIRA